MPKNIKKIFSRIITKHDLEVNWLRNSNFVPLQGELIIYDCEVDAAGNTLGIPSNRSVPYTYERLKLGDGFTSVNDLPFIDGAALADGELDVNSTKPVQNKVIATAITDINTRVGTVPVATQISEAIANQQHFSGDYNDLTNAPVLPEYVSDLEDDLGIATTAYVDLVKKEIPTLISQLENDSNYVNDTDLQTVKDSIPDISNLVNKEYVDNMFSAVPKFEVMVVETLPTENISSTTVYLLKSDESVDSLYDEYIYVNGTWELLGSAKINLDGYAKTENVPTKVSQLENDSNFTSEAQVEALYKKLNSNTVLGFYCIEDVTVVVDGISTTYPANSNVEIKLLETDTFEIIPTSDNSILTLTAFPGALGTYYSWLEGVKQFSNILFDMNAEDMYTKWNQGNQGAYQVQYAQYLNCIFWSDNPYIADLSKRTNYTLYYSAQLPLCYSTIPDNTFKAFYLAFGVNSDPNWGNKAYRDSFANANWATQVFSYYGARTIGIFGHDDPDFNIILPPDCRGLMSAATAIENAGTFDAINVTNFGAKSGSWRDAFGWCNSLRQLYIKNLKVNLNVSWSPLDYDSIYFIISTAANTSAITISVSPYTYNLLSQSDFDLAASKNITVELLTANYIEDRRLSAIANKADKEEVLLKTEQTLSNEELDQVRKNLKFIGKNVEGQTFTIDETAVVAAASAEIFGDYENNIAVGQWSIAEGCTTIAKGKVAHAEGAFTKALADGCHTEGYGTEATGYWSHAEGEYTRVTSYASHAEGSYSKDPDGNTRYGTASGYASHVEGGGCYTTGVAAHAEGICNTANGRCSHAEGVYTIASGKAQHVEGVGNIEDTADAYIHIAGNGDWGARSNAHTLDWEGNAWYSGDVYVGSTSGINKDDGSIRLARIDEIPDTETFATKEALDAKADKSELPSLDGLATEEYVDTAIRNITSGSGITLQRLSQEEYDLIDKDPNTLYIIV